MTSILDGAPAGLPLRTANQETAFDFGVWKVLAAVTTRFILLKSIHVLSAVSLGNRSASKRVGRRVRVRTL
jgi:hypothetical protein